MRVYLNPPDVASPSLMRVTQALIKYKPDWVEIVDSEYEADLVILHVIGRQDQVTNQAWKLNVQDKDYAVIQYAIRSTMRPETLGWMPLWRHAKVVWSYYDLPELVAEDGILEKEAYFDFYHSPLGVDEIFKSSGSEKKFIIATSGQSYLTESVKECAVAAKAFGFDVFHLGNELRREGIVCKTGISDLNLADMYSQSYYVSGLRRIEGFELPAAEGLLCGARPIMFDKPHYRQWFDGLAIFIPELSREQTEKNIKTIFKDQFGLPVTDEEIEKARKLFNWETIIAGFWRKLFYDNADKD